MVYKHEIWHRYSLRVTFWEKGVGHPKIQHGGHFFKKATISVKCSLCQSFKQWYRHNILWKYSLNNVFLENGACPSKIQDGNHFSSWPLFLLNPYINFSNGDAIIKFGTNILQGTFSWKKVCATQKFKMATIFKMAIISIRAQFNVLWTVLFNRVNIVTQPGYTGDFTAVELSMGFNVSWSSFTYNVVLD